MTLGSTVVLRQQSLEQGLRRALSSTTKLIVLALVTNMMEQERARKSPYARSIFLELDYEVCHTCERSIEELFESTNTEQLLPLHFEMEQKALL